MHYSQYPSQIINHGRSQLAVSDLELKDKMQEIITELRIMNTYNALGHDEEIKAEEVTER
jgi:hypothetical protein